MEIDRATCIIPEWLDSPNLNTILNDEFDKQNVLANSVFYPSSAYDGHLVKHLGKYFQSFVYVDHSFDKKMLMSEFIERPFTGYYQIAGRFLSLNELIQEPWMPLGLSDRSEFPEEDWSGLVNKNKARLYKFAYWAIFERRKEFSISHGPIRFSILFLKAEAVTAFKNVYIKNNLFPEVIAVIQPGYGFGGNWSNFLDPYSIFPQTVMNNKAGVPRYIATGGWSPRKYIENYWHWFTEFRGWYQHSGPGGSVGIWERMMGSNSAT